MPLSRKSKIWLIVPSVPVILILALVIVLKVMFTGEKLKEMVVPRAEAAIGRPVAIRDISLVVFPSIALEIDGVSIANRKGEGFSPDPFLTLDAVRLNVKLLPLLKSRIEVTSLILDRPRLLLEVNRRNETNYSDLSGGGRPAPQPASGAGVPGGPGPGAPGPAGTGSAAAEGSPAAFLVSNLLINNGSVDYVNFKDNSAAHVRNLSVAMDLGTEGGKVVVGGNAVTDSLSYGTVESPLLDGLRIRIDNRMSYDLSSGVLDVERGDMSIQDIHLALKGRVSRVGTTSLLDLTLRSDSLNIADLFSLIPHEYMKKAEGVKGNGTAKVLVTIKGALTDSTTADVSGTVSASDASIQYPQLPKPITGITLLADFTKTKSKQEFHIARMTANLGGSPFSMSMRVVNFDNPYVTLEAAGALNLATVPEFYPLEKGTELGGAVKADIRLEGRISDPKAMRGSGSLTFRDVSVKTAGTAKPVRNVNGTLTINNELAEASKLSLLIGGSDMTLSCRVKNYLSLVSTDRNAPPASATMVLQSNHLYAKDLMGEQPPPGTGAQKEESPKGGNVQSSPPSRAGAKTPPAASPGRASGKAAFPLPSMEIDATASIGTLTMEKFEFTNIKGAMRVAKGVITMQNLSLNAFGGSVVSTGSLDLNKSDRPLFDLSLNLNGVEAAQLLSHFTSFGQRLSGALTTSTKLKGALNDTLGLVPDALEGGERLP